GVNTTRSPARQGKSHSFCLLAQSHTSPPFSHTAKSLWPARAISKFQIAARVVKLSLSLTLPFLARLRAKTWKSPPPPHATTNCPSGEKRATKPGNSLTNLPVTVSHTRTDLSPAPRRAARKWLPFAEISTAEYRSPAFQRTWWSGSLVLAATGLPL